MSESGCTVVEYLKEFLPNELIDIISHYVSECCRICQLLADLHKGGTYDKLKKLIEEKDLDFTDLKVKQVCGYIKLRFKLSNMLQTKWPGCTKSQTKVEALCDILQELPVPPDTLSSTSTRKHQHSKLACCGRISNGCNACPLWRRKIVHGEWKLGCGLFESFDKFLDKPKDGKYHVNDFNRLIGFRGLLKTLNYKLNTCQDCQLNVHRLREILSCFNAVQTAEKLIKFTPDVSVQRFKPLWCCANCKYFTLGNK
jgi:hypothetical protein